MTRHIPPILSRPRRTLLDLIIPLLAFAGGVPRFMGVRIA
jgi:hypothetical protein